MRTVNVKQLSVFIENKAGRVSEITDVLGEAGVNIRGFSVSDTADYGIVRLVVDDPDAGLAALCTRTGSPSRSPRSSASTCPITPAGWPASSRSSLTPASTSSTSTA